jgi:DNA-binding beta-propeller fold protein YncE
MPLASATTLLVVRPATATLDLVDPGSGLRLASIVVGNGPRKVGVSPDGRQAAVANCATANTAAG